MVFFSLINWWNANKDELPLDDDDGVTWRQENSAMIMQHKTR